MTNPNPTIRPATRQEINLALDWAAAEGWNPGICDAVPFHAADPEGFLVGLVDDEPVAVISAVKYGTTFGFIGFYIVRPDVRGLGYGWAIWQAAMARTTTANPVFGWRIAMCDTRVWVVLVSTASQLPGSVYRSHPCRSMRWRSMTRGFSRRCALNFCTTGLPSHKPRRWDSWWMAVSPVTL